MKVFGGGETKMVAKNVADDTKYHMDDILSLDISIDRKTIVTGQVGKSPSIHVWDPETMESKVLFKLTQTARGVAALAISPCQRYVAAVDLHNDHHVVIYNIKRKKELLHIEGSKDKIINVAWSRKPEDLRFVTLGVKEIKFWNPADATKRLFVKGTFGNAKNMTNFGCIVFDTDGYAYTAGANGQVAVWNTEGQFDKSVKAHSNEVTALCHEQGKLITGGKDSKICIFSARNGECKLEKTLEGFDSYARGLDYMNGRILIGLRNGFIFEANEQNDDRRMLMGSHHEGEAWGLEVVPDAGSIFTVGDDNKIMEFNYHDKRFVRQGIIAPNATKNTEKAKKVTASTLSQYPANQQGRAIAYCKHNNHIAVSNNMGKVTIRNRDNLNVKIKSLKDAEEWCEVIKYSPCG
jgi:microtubule-associated protein-like 6